MYVPLGFFRHSENCHPQSAGHFSFSQGLPIFSASGFNELKCQLWQSHHIVIVIITLLTKLSKSTWRKHLLNHDFLPPIMSGNASAGRGGKDTSFLLSRASLQMGFFTWAVMFTTMFHVNTKNGGYSIGDLTPMIHTGKQKDSLCETSSYCKRWIISQSWV